MLRYRASGAPATLWLILVNVAVWLVALIVDAIFPGDPAETALPLHASPAVTLHRPWTPLTYMVTHFSILHLLFNMLWLYWFGRMSESVTGSKRLVWSYLGGGLVGGLLYLGCAACGWIAPNSTLVGASAAVLCIMTATAIRTPDLEVNLLLLGPIRQKWFALLCILLAMLGLGGGNSGGVVAHIGGVITGAAIGVYEHGILRRLKSKAKFRMHRRRVKVELSRLADASPTPREQPLSPEQRLDQLLDKIKISGYGSLSQKERDELTDLSKKLK